MSEDSTRLQELDEFLRPCLEENALDSHMETPEIFRALDGFPENPSLTLTVYALHRQRILQQSVERPFDTLNDDQVEDAAMRLCLVSLRRIGFLLSFDHGNGRVKWTINPLHPQKRTLASLKIASPALHQFAKFISEFEKAKALTLQEQIAPPRSTSPSSSTRKSRARSRPSCDGQAGAGGASS